MADSPPPLDNVEISQEEEEIGEKDEVCQDSSDEPLFAETASEVVTEKPKEQEEPKASLPAPTLETTAAVEEPAVPATQDLVESASSKPLDLFGDDQMEAEVSV